MFDRIPNILIGLLAFWPHIALANSGTVRAGEHGAFTRLTISTEQDIKEVEQIRQEARLFTFKVSPELDRIDVSRLFERLSANRIESLAQSEDGLELLLNCDCIPRVTNGIGRLVVIDVVDAPKDVALSLPKLPVIAGRFPDRLATGEISGPVGDPFDLDFSVVDRLTRRIAADISQNSHISGFSNVTAHSPNLTGRTAVAAVPISERDLEQSRAAECFWSNAVWTEIDGESSQIKALSHISEDGFDLKSVLYIEIAKLLSQGLVDEAEVAFQASGPSLGEIVLFSDFINGLTGLSPLRSQRFGDCNPLEDVVIATAKHAADVPNGIKLGLLHTFGDLPIGLQIMLFPRLSWLLDSTGAALFPDLIIHHQAEAAIMDRIPVDAESTESDPDRLAAVALELRGTEFEQESWLATFASFLDHQRYFDALTELHSDNPLSKEAASGVVSEFVDHLVTHSDSVTFVQIALAEITSFDPAPSSEDMQRVADRLYTEGFREQASQIGNKRTQAAPQADGAPSDQTKETNALDMTDNGGVLVAAPPADTAKQTGQSEHLSVATAQKQLESAEVVRQALLKTFAN